MQRDSDTEGDTEPEETKKREVKGKEKLAAGGDDEDEDTEEDEKDEVEVVLAAIAEAQRRRMHPNNAAGGEEEVRVMGGVDGEGEQQQQQQRRRHRRLRRFPSFEGLGRRAFACVRHLLLDANHLPSIPDGTYAFVFTLNTHVTAHCLCLTHTQHTEAYFVWFYFG